MSLEQRREAPGVLDQLRSIRTKWAVVMVGAVVVASALSGLGAAASAPWVLTALVAVAGGLVVTQVLAAGMVTPLRRMTDVARAMSRGDLSGRVPEPTSMDEVGVLARVFNTMADDLARVDAERRDLIATVSHELRTPLAGMSAVLENLVDGVVPADLEHLSRALAQSERLGDLVEDLLELSRLELGAVDLRREPVLLAGLVAQCADEVRAQGRDVALDVRVPEDLLVRADATRLRQLLRNALDNATRHSPTGGTVTVTGASGTAEGSWWVEVEDRGAGVDPEDRERVFERFGTDAESGSTGLGLAISRWVAQLHGGTLQFLDPRDGIGARLRLEVGSRPASLTPTAPTAPAPTAPAPAAAARAPHPLPAPAPVPPTGPHRVWPEPAGLPSRRPVALTAVVGLAAAIVLGDQGPGLSWFLVVALAGALTWSLARFRGSWFTRAGSVVAAALVLPVVLYRSPDSSALGILAAGAVFLAVLTAAATPAGFVASWIAWPLSSLRGFGWFTRALRPSGEVRNLGAVLRTVAVLAVGLLVFGGLFASADVVFAGWVDALVPDLRLSEWVVRGFVGCLVFGVTLAAVYLGINPPDVEGLTRVRIPHGRRWEWLVPLGGVVLVFVGFVAAQATALFGGSDYVRSRGLTYAEYVHDGFGQMVVATLLTLVVIRLAAAFAAPQDRRWLFGGTGALAVLALVVAVSALVRMDAYADAYGYTVLRLFVTVFELWVALLLVLVLVFGGLGRGSWLPRTGLLTGGGMLAVLLLANPAAWAAGHNLDRYHDTGKLDVVYLGTLGPDAAGVVADRAPEFLPCLAGQVPDRAWDATWRDWTLVGSQGLDLVRPVRHGECLGPAE